MNHHTMVKNPEILRYERLAASASAVGLICRGGFHPLPEDGVPTLAGGADARTLILLGFTAGEPWSIFSRSPEFGDGQADPLDRWSRRTIEMLALTAGATALYPFTGPPWWPFQRWAQRSERLHASPLGILMHPDFGLWHGYRGALLFDTRIEVPAHRDWPHPCASCDGRPCLRVCPVEAVAIGHFAACACRDHVAGGDGGPCRSGGCLARRACPEARDRQYGPEQSAFHMKAFFLAPKC
jgi:hypothetical protein